MPGGLGACKQSGHQPGQRRDGSPRRARAQAAGPAQDSSPDTRTMPGCGVLWHHAQPWLQLLLPHCSSCPSPWGLGTWHRRVTRHLGCSLWLSKALGRMDGWTDRQTEPLAPASSQCLGRPGGRGDGGSQRQGVRMLVGGYSGLPRRPSLATQEDTAPALPGPPPAEQTRGMAAPCPALPCGAAAPAAPNGPHAAAVVAAGAGWGPTPGPAAGRISSYRR